MQELPVQSACPAPSAGWPGPTGLCSLSQANSSTSVTFFKKLMDRSSPTHSFYFSLESHSPAQNEWPEDITEPLSLPGSGPAQPPQTTGAQGPTRSFKPSPPLPAPPTPILPLPSSRRNHISFSKTVYFSLISSKSFTLPVSNSGLIR